MTVEKRVGFCMLFAWLVLAGAPLAAQQTETVAAQQPPASAGQQPQSHDAIAENLFPPDLVLSNQKAIGLDDAQKNYVRSEVLKAQTRFTDLQFQLQDGMETLIGLLKQSPVDEAQVMAQLDKVLNAEREVKRTQVALMVRIKNKLTAEQQARLRQIRSKPAGE